MRPPEALEGVLESIEALGFEEAEVLHKKGRSRTMRFSEFGESTSLRQEEGWAARAGDSRRSFFYCASGAPRAETRWPDADGSGLRLPSARPALPWTAPSTLDAPLIGESEARGFFTGLARELDNELPGARLVAGHLDDGSSESILLSSRDIATTVRYRTAALHLEAAGPDEGSRSLSLDLVERDARRFSPAALARRLADLLLVAERGTARPRDRGEFLLAPSVVVGLISALNTLWLGPRAEKRATDMIDRRGRLASSDFTLIDDGRLSGGILEAPFDGEGQPTREIVLVEEGSFRQPLLAWWQAGANPRSASGCSLRPGWRDLPRPGPTHLYLQPDPRIRAASLIGSLTRGYYLIDLTGRPQVDSSSGRFAAPVCGFAIEGGRPTGTVAGAWLVGSIASFLGGIVAKARDLTFSIVNGGMVGSPSVLVKGLELRQRT
ncbi:MAG: metallopeptidase TldD-related protein [Acidobacteriota bacterium]